MTASQQQLDAGSQRRIAAALERRSRELDARELRVGAVFAAAFLAVAVALAVLGHADTRFSLPLAAAFVVVYVGVAHVEFSIGGGAAVPTQVVFVPMLLLLPTPLTPLLVACGLVATSAVNVVRGRLGVQRLLYAFADSWFAVGPALVLVALGAQRPAWAHLPAYALALAAQFLGDGAISLLRLRLATGTSPRNALADLSLVYRVDVLLAPVGLLAAIGAADKPAAALAVVPLVSLLAIFARERETRIAHSLELGRAYRGTALLLRDLLEEDDEYTGHHTEDVVELSAAVARQLGLDEDLQRETELGALLHDIGKIHIPDAIINKPGKLDAEEWAIMKTHTVEGQKMLDQVGGLLGSVGVVVRASHERYDGGGYPDGLAGEAIPLPARIVSACDAFNAMTTTRSYRKALPVSVAVQELRDNAGTQFDPRVVEALLAVVGDPGWEASLVEAPAAAPSRGAVPAT
ncbi:MAG TPA: HD-GYP domain-containing protein [Solirubrobacteraceae bacterium]|jgi:putative nucleotidyltransferase with HDIG domain